MFSNHNIQSHLFPPMSSNALFSGRGFFYVSLEEIIRRFCHRAWQRAQADLTHSTPPIRLLIQPPPAGACDCEIPACDRNGRT